MKKDSKVYLRHIFDSISMIEKFTKGFSIADFRKDIKAQDAVIRRIEIIGEAVKNLSQEVRRKHQEIKWKEIAGTRDILIHAYFSVDIELIWNIIKMDLPGLKKAIMKELDTGL